MTNDQEHDFLNELVEAARNVLSCVDANDGDSLANATNDLRKLLQQLGEAA